MLSELVALELTYINRYQQGNSIYTAAATYSKIDPVDVIADRDSLWVSSDAMKLGSPAWAAVFLILLDLLRMHAK